MVSLGPFARKVYDAMIALGATSENGIKSADQIMEKAKLGKGQINLGLQELLKNKVVGRIARSKRAGYYICQQI
ncbi:MAG: transcriptional regulator [Candidatus Altiarchaeota archaeon]|nr:transcriptional regulator [Candidatus Altiarchaeota archaeon]